jgi:hypothetical protein
MNFCAIYLVWCLLGQWCYEARPAQMLFRCGQF